MLPQYLILYSILTNTCHRKLLKGHFLKCRLFSSGRSSLSVHKLLLFLANQHFQQRLMLWNVYDFWMSNNVQQMSNTIKVWFSKKKKSWETPLTSMIPPWGVSCWISPNKTFCGEKKKKKELKCNFLKNKNTNWSLFYLHVI